MYELRLDPEVIEFLEKVPKLIRKRIFNKISSTKENPFHYFKRLIKINCYKLKIGNYRVIAEINKKDQIIHITRAGHRRNIYKRNF